MTGEDPNLSEFFWGNKLRMIGKPSSTRSGTAEKHAKGGKPPWRTELKSLEFVPGAHPQLRALFPGQSESVEGQNYSLTQ